MGDVHTISTARGSKEKGRGEKNCEHKFDLIRDFAAPLGFNLKELTHIFDLSPKNCLPFGRFSGIIPPFSQKLGLNQNSP